MRICCRKLSVNKCRTSLFCCIIICQLIPSLSLSAAEPVAKQVPAMKEGLLPTERLVGEGIWTVDKLKQPAPQTGEVHVTVWFDEQLLGDGAAYLRRAEELAKQKRRPLRKAAVATLKALSHRSWNAAEKEIDKLKKQKIISHLKRHWIVNGFSCKVKLKGFQQFKKIPGIKKIFTSQGGNPFIARSPAAQFYPEQKRDEYNPDRFKHPWYSRYLMADKVWKEFKVSGQGTLNIVHDFNFAMSDNIKANLYRNPKEIPGNKQDDDGNGLVDDYHGYNFRMNSPAITLVAGNSSMRTMHGHLCAAIICGAGLAEKTYEFGIAPQGKWAGLIAGNQLEGAIEWAIEQGADTYSMSFSIPNLGEYRSHWRKVMEHGSLCGVYFVSGAGNFAQTAAVPVQMRVPEDIPNVVFAAAGVQRNFQRTPFSSKGPVKWNTEHYHDGLVNKPEVCAFNMGLPVLLPDGTALPSGANGNSFAGPMFCGCIALMLSADPDLLPWDLREIITETASDVAKEGVDDETGHGLINCYRAVKEVLRRKMLRDGGNAEKYTGREKGDTFDVDAVKQRLKKTNLKVLRVQPGSQADKQGIKPGDIIRTYHNQPVTNPQEMRAAKNKAAKENIKNIPVVVERAGKQIAFDLTAGPLGIIPVVEFADPTFK